MKRHLPLIWLGTLLTSLWALNGCGEKIMIPQPDGLFGIAVYREWARFQGTSPFVDLTVSQGRLFTLTADSLAKRNLGFSQSDSVGGLSGATALCVVEDSNLVFVWQDNLKQMNWYSGRNLVQRGSTVLAGVATATAIAANDAGIEQVPGALTFLYLSDPVSGVVHRFAFDMFNGLTPHGILARSDGDAARFVHLPGGMATDIENRFLVCDADTLRNWVIRFDATPDTSDTAPVSGDPDPMRGVAVPFLESGCLVPPASDFVLGFAAQCGEVGWVGRPGHVDGEMYGPTHVAVDGKGRIFVVDTRNDRIEIFSRQGDFELQLGSLPETPGATAVGVYDHRTGAGVDQVNYGAFVFVLIPGENQVRKFISSEHADYLNQELPPPPN